MWRLLGPKWSKWQRKCGCEYWPVPSTLGDWRTSVWFVWGEEKSLMLLSSGCWWRESRKPGHIFLTVCIRVSFTARGWTLWNYWSCFLVVIPDVGFEIPDRFVVGYALDYNEYFRDLNVSPVTFWSQKSSLLWEELRSRVSCPTWLFWTLTRLSLSLSLFFLAHLCHQRKWKDEIQDLTRKGRAPEATVTPVMSQRSDNICSQTSLWCL